jgi:hypothetical protein
MKKAVKVILFNIALIALILALFEGAMYALVHQPALLKHFPKGIRNSIGYLYNFGERRIIQFTPECARYDAELGYTLKPGACVFSATEFRNRYQINSRGLRDDESSLHAPAIIVAGDSYAMGWGVEQEESFAEVLEKKSALKVLNTAVASYGTAREMLALKRLDTSRLRYLIIQYCENDEEENRAFFQQGNRLQTMRPEEYERHTQENNQPKGYYPGKYIGMKLEKKWKEFGKSRDKKQERAGGPDDVDLFLNALMKAPGDLKGVQIIVLEAVGKDDFNRDFIKRLQERIQKGGYPPPVKNLVTLDITKVLTKGHYYVLDDHWIPAGHQAVADALWQIITKTRNE